MPTCELNAGSGESSFRQDEYEDAMARFDDLGVKLSVVGIDFQHPEQAVDKTKSRNKVREADCGNGVRLLTINIAFV